MNEHHYGRIDRYNDVTEVISESNTIVELIGSSGFVVVTQKIQQRDLCQLVIGSKVVWDCNITNLLPGMEYEYENFT